MNRKVLLWLSLAAVLAVLVAYQTLGSSAARRAEVTARADVPTVQPGIDVLAGIAVLPASLADGATGDARSGHSLVGPTRALGGPIT